MSEVKFTKGEWIKSHQANGEVYVTHRDMRRNSGRFICTLQGRDDVANAYLIAAAPEMYAMLQRWVDSYECVDDNYQDGVNSDTIDLLAKARGE